MVASSSDPVAEGVAVSLARPGGNVTGLTYTEPDRVLVRVGIVRHGNAAIADAAGAARGPQWFRS
jgi:hypothetical protein